MICFPNMDSIYFLEKPKIFNSFMKGLTKIRDTENWWALQYYKEINTDFYLYQLLAEIFLAFAEGFCCNYSNLPLQYESSQTMGKSEQECGIIPIKLIFTKQLMGPILLVAIIC